MICISIRYITPVSNRKRKLIEFEEQKEKNLTCSWFEDILNFSPNALQIWRIKNPTPLRPIRQIFSRLQFLIVNNLWVVPNKMENDLTTKKIHWYISEVCFFHLPESGQQRDFFVFASETSTNGGQRTEEFCEQNWATVAFWGVRWTAGGSHEIPVHLWTSWFCRNRRCVTHMSDLHMLCLGAYFNQLVDLISRDKVGMCHHKNFLPITQSWYEFSWRRNAKRLNTHKFCKRILYNVSHLFGQQKESVNLDPLNSRIASRVVRALSRARAQILPFSSPSNPCHAEPINRGFNLRTEAAFSKWLLVVSIMNISECSEGVIVFLTLIVVHHSEFVPLLKKTYSY